VNLLILYKTSPNFLAYPYNKHKDSTHILGLLRESSINTHKVHRIVPGSAPQIICLVIGIALVISVDVVIFREKLQEMLIKAEIIWERDLNLRIQV
jgi:hypothetical protein